MEYDNTILTFNEIASNLDKNRELVIDALVNIETYQMANLELNKTLRALRSYSKEIPYLIERRPIGKVGVVLPFNTPLYSLVLYAFGPLLAGNRVFVKASSLTSEVITEIYKTCIGDFLEPALTLHPPGQWFLRELCLKNEKVDAISFTGQWSSIDHFIRQIPGNVRVIYSGSGCNPFIVLSNADISCAVEKAISSRLWNSGQDCLATERFYVENEVYDEFIEKLIEKIKKTSCGDNHDFDVTVGPLISKSAVEHVLAVIKSSEGTSRILHKGEIQDRLVTPFVFEADPVSPILLTEKYAPIFAVTKFHCRDDASLLANQGNYALAATVWGEDSDFIEGLNFPHIANNTSILDIEDEDAHIPFGGYKNSGFVRQKSTGYFKSGPILYSVETTVSQNSSSSLLIWR